MLDLLDCLMPACHEESAVTTPAVADVTFVAVITRAMRRSTRAEILGGMPSDVISVFVKRPGR